MRKVTVTDEKIIIEQDRLSASDVIIETVSSLAGVAFGACTGVYLDRFLPVAANSFEKVIRYTTVGLGGFTAGACTAKAVEVEMQDSREAAIMMRLQMSGLLDKEKMEEAMNSENKEETKKVSAKK